MSRILYIVSLLFIAVASVHANEIKDVRTPEQQLFLALEHEAQHGNKSMYRRLLKKLANYPLRPYAESLYLQRFLRYSHRHEIFKFLQTYPDAPFSVPLRKKWLNYLAAKRYKKTFVAQYMDIGDAKLACLNLRWQLQLGAEAREVLPQVTDLWLAPNSQPRACDPLFKLWKESGYLTSEVALTRLIMAAK